MTFTTDQALRVQQALRSAAGLAKGEGGFPDAGIHRDPCDDIETLRKQGKSDEEITALISAAAATISRALRSPKTMPLRNNDDDSFDVNVIDGLR